jgi:uncharacterized protein YyaL (SSP411 family)
MKILLITLFGSFLIPNTYWQTDFEKARQSASAEHKLIVLNFSGSDWCGPCIRMHNEIFESNDFTQYAGQHLILVNADFPRLKKNQLPKDQQRKNDQLADVYNKEGIFPLTLLLTPDGRVLKKWEGFPNVSAGQFTNEVKVIFDGAN